MIFALMAAGTLMAGGLPRDVAPHRLGTPTPSAADPTDGAAIPGTVLPEPLGVMQPAPGDLDGPAATAPRSGTS